MPTRNGVSTAASAATSAKASSENTARAPESARTYLSSSAVQCQLTTT